MEEFSLNYVNYVKLGGGAECADKSIKVQSSVAEVGQGAREGVDGQTL